MRRAETKGVSIFHMVGEYRHLIPRLLQDKAVLKAVAVSVILYITNMVNTNFFSLYVTQRLGLSENFLALFPILNAAVMLVFMVGIQHRLSATKVPRPPVDRPGAVRRCRFGAHLLPGGQPGLCAYLRVCGRGGRLPGEPPQGRPAPAEHQPPGAGPLKRLDYGLYHCAVLPLWLPGRVASPAWTAGCPLCSALCCSWWPCWLSAASKSPLWRRKPPKPQLVERNDKSAAVCRRSFCAAFWSKSIF